MSGNKEKNNQTPTPQTGGRGLQSTRLGRTDGIGRRERRKDKEAARQQLDEILTIENPVERLVEFAKFFEWGPGYDLSENDLQIDLKKTVRKQVERAFGEIKARVKKESDPVSYLKDVLEETNPEWVADFTSWHPVGRLHRQVRAYMEHLSSEKNEAGEDDRKVSAPKERFRFRGPRSSLRRLLNGIYEDWIDKGEVGKEEFFRVVGGHFETNSGPIDAEEAMKMRKKAGGYPPADAQEIDALLDSVSNRKSD